MAQKTITRLSRRAQPESRMSSRTLRTLAVFAIAALAAPLAASQEFPAKPIRLVVPFPPAGAVDVVGVGRALATPLGKALGQSARDAS